MQSLSLGKKQKQEPQRHSVKPHSRAQGSVDIIDELFPANPDYCQVKTKNRVFERVYLRGYFRLI